MLSAVKNSWSETFGESGYFRLLRNDSKCDAHGGMGILTTPVYPVLA
jgi:hypothetical protein